MAQPLPPSCARREVAAPHLVNFRRWPLVYALAATVPAYLQSAGNVFRLQGVLAWIAAISFWLYAWWPRERPAVADPSRPRDLKHWRVLLALGVVVMVGVFFRFHRITLTPLDPTSDHSEKLLDVQDVLDGQHPIFFPRNTGREPAQFYVIASMVRGLGLPETFDTMKLGTAAVDVLAIPAVFLLAREMAGPGAGLGAAVAYSISIWPVSIARAGLRYPYAPLPTALALWLLMRYLRRGDRRDALLLGLVLGLGLFGYSPFRVVPLVVPLAFGIVSVVDAQWRGQRLKLMTDGALAALTTLIVFIPLGRFLIERPDLFWYRAATRAAGDDVLVRGDWAAVLGGLQTFFLNNARALFAFNVQGDATYVSTLNRAPFLDTLSGIMLLLGVVVALRTIVVKRDIRWLVMLTSLPILLLSSTLAISFPIEVPSANRAGPVAPPIFALVGLGLASWLGPTLRSRKVSTRLLAIALLFGGLFIAIAENYDRYFIRFDRQYRDFVPNTKEIARAARDEIAQGLTLDQVYIVDWPYWLDKRNLGIELGDIRWGEQHLLSREASLSVLDNRELLLIVNREDTAHLEEITRRWPTAVIRRVASAIPSKDFYLAHLPSR